jgi:dipeptidase E
VLRECGLDEVLTNYSKAGGIFIGNSGGSMQVTRNVGLFLLNKENVRMEDISYLQYSAMGLVNFEFLPHFNKHSKEFLDRVEHYSMVFNTKIFSCADGGAIFVDDHQMYVYGEAYVIVGGTTTRLKTDTLFGRVK